jgi:thioredoxin-related protein
MSVVKYTLTTLLFFVSLTMFGQEIKWMTWNEAVDANAKQPKKIFVDVYTDWCGWCKRMDQTTFKDSSVVAFMSEYFYAVKLNAEQKESIFLRDMEFKWVEGGRNGYNTLAAELLDRQMSYPTFVLLDSEFARIMISPGYKEPPMLLKQLMFAKEEAYRNGGTWEAYQSKS